MIQRFQAFLLFCPNIYILKSAYLGSLLLLSQVLLKTMEHCLLFLIVIFQVFLFIFIVSGCRW